MAHHHCHALNSERNVPPRMHMCAPHWRMVPKANQNALWAAYKPGQERRMSPSVEYLHAAAACVHAVAEAEGQPPDEIESECSTYLAWAEMLTDAPAEGQEDQHGE